jgi:hypothetical protein
MELQWVAYRAGHGEVLATFATFSLPPICAIKDAVPLWEGKRFIARIDGQDKPTC